MPQDRNKISANDGAYMAIAPAQDSTGLFASFAWTPRFLTKTADYTVLRTDAGTFFNTVGATAAVNFTLPAISTGPWQFWFLAGAAQNMTVTSATADTILTFNDLAADSVVFSTSGEIIGGLLWAICDGTTLAVVQIGGVSHRQTLTVNT